MGQCITWSDERCSDLFTETRTWLSVRSQLPLTLWVCAHTLSVNTKPLKCMLHGLHRLCVETPQILPRLGISGGARTLGKLTTASVTGSANQALRIRSALSTQGHSNIPMLHVGDIQLWAKGKLVSMLGNRIHALRHTTPGYVKLFLPAAE